MEKKCKIIIKDKYCKGCRYCIVDCPKNVLKISTEPSANGYNIVYVDCPEACICCRKCEYICPEMAIWVQNIEEILNKKEEVVQND